MHSVPSEQRIRPAAVAGLFYSGDAGTLAEEVGTYLAEAAETASPAPIKAIIVPHAGYIYSAPIAASAYRALARQGRNITRVVLLGPTHRVAVRGLAVPSWDAFSTPLGSVPLDRQAAAALLALPQVVEDDACHALEHALEVQLPFLQATLGHFSLVPLAVGQASGPEVAQALDLLWGGPETLIVVSSDLSHYLPYGAARQRDQATCQRILQGCSDIRHDEACGATPINGLLLAARHHGLSPHLLDLRNSGDTAGDKERVVGYAAFTLEPGHVPA